MSNLMREKNIQNMLLDIRKLLPNQKMTKAVALAYVNGLAQVYQKTIRDFDPVTKMVNDTDMKETIYRLYLKQAKHRGRDCGFKGALNKYIQSLPKEFAELIDFNIFTGKYNRVEVENMLAELSYKISKKAAKVEMKVKEKPENNNLYNLEEQIKKYYDTKGILKDGIDLAAADMIEEEGVKDVKDYVNLLAQRLVSDMVDYADELSEDVIRFYSQAQLEREARERNSYYDDERFLGEDELVR